MRQRSANDIGMTTKRVETDRDKKKPQILITFFPH